MTNKLKVGDIIKCSNEDDMVDTMIHLQKHGIDTDFSYEKDGEEGYWLVVEKVEEEMSAEEVVEWIRCGCMDDRFADVFHCNVNADVYGVLDNYSSKEIVKRASEWKADHEKKEPEVELVYQVSTWNCDKEDPLKRRVYVETIDEAEEKVKELVMKFPYAEFTYMRVCRVKGGKNE